MLFNPIFQPRGACLCFQIKVINFLLEMKGERSGKKHGYEREAERNIDQLPHSHALIVMELAAAVCALTGIELSFAATELHCPGQEPFF